MNAPDVQRLIVERLKETDVGIQAPLNVGASWTTQHARAIRSSPAGSELDWGGEPIVMSLTGTIPAEDYHSFTFRMLVDASPFPRNILVTPVAVFRWLSPLETALVPETEIAVPIILDGKFHNYEIPLWSSRGSAWLGDVSHIVFVPCNVPGNIRIESLGLGHAPPTHPVRVTAGFETHDALFGSQAPWRVAVPKNATFETYVGMGAHAWRWEESDGVSFHVQLTDAKGRVVDLGSEAFNPRHNEADRGWRLLQADLSDYAGQMVSITLTVDPRQNLIGDYAYWGAPQIYSRSDASDDIPVILISIDTLRADHVSCYGYFRKTTTYLDEFRRDAILFENAMCPVSLTLPSHATMLTGLYPKNHRVSHTVNMPEEIVTLAEGLSEAGYITAAFTGVNGYLSPRYGFSHGFDIYNTPDWIRLIEETHRLTLDWLDIHKRPKFFLFLHNFDVHGKPKEPGSKGFTKRMPYYPPREEDFYFSKKFEVPPLLRFENPALLSGEEFLGRLSYGSTKIDEKTLQYLRALYDDGIRYMDRELGKFLDELKTRALYDRALIIVTADHGEEFGEHGRFIHHQIYEECQHVPLLIKLPHNERAGESFAPVVQLVDLMPTIYDCLDLALPGPTDGQSLLKLLSGEEKPLDKAYGSRSDQKRIRTSDWAFLMDSQKGKRDLFNIREDPREKRPVPESSNPNQAALVADLETHFAVPREGWNIDCRSARRHGITQMEITALFESAIAGADIAEAEGIPQFNLDEYKVINAGKGVEAKMNITAKDRDTLIIRPTQGGHRMRISLKFSRVVEVLVGREVAYKVGSIELTLDPETMDLSKPDEVPIEEAGLPQIAIWFEEPSMALPAGQELTQKEKEELEALGYLQ